MRTPMISLLLALTWTVTSNGGETDTAAMKVERFRLENGLSVIVRPITGSDKVALLLLYNLGGDHDPIGRSGLAHLVEHVYVTAAADKQAARTAEDYFRRYPSGCNAQTSDRYTVVATVFPKGDLAEELREAAARMGDLRVTAADLDRERPRVLDEVANMFGRLVPLGAVNNARELARPTPRGGRKGGQPDQVRTITLEDVRSHWRRHYKPRNATIVVAGPVDARAVRTAITEQFAAITAGEEAAAAEPDTPKFGALKNVDVNSLLPHAEPMACLAYAAPRPDSALYAPFLVLMSRLWAGAGKLGGGPGALSIYFPPIDDGAVVAVSIPAKRGEQDAAFSRLEAFVAEAINPGLIDGEVAATKQQLGFYLGTVELPDFVLAQNPYGVAFSLGRREQLGLDPARLNRAMEAVTDRDLRRVSEEVFGAGRQVRALVTPQQ